MSTTQRLVDVSAVDFDQVFDSDVRGAFFVAQEVARRMVAREQQNFRCRIGTVASVAGVLPRIGMHCMSKSAPIQMTRAQALERGRDGMRAKGTRRLRAMLRRRRDTDGARRRSRAGVLRQGVR